jgi:hypothetical protein
LGIRFHTDLTPFLGEDGSTSIDLSRAIRLKDMVFWPNSRSVKWITMALETITRNHRYLRKISIPVNPHDIPSADVNIREVLGEQIYGQWLDLDRFLNQFWGLLSIRINAARRITKGRHDIRDYIGCLLPKMKERGVIDLVGESNERDWSTSTVTIVIST